MSALRLCFSSGGRAFSVESGLEPINTAPTRHRCAHPVCIAQRGEGGVPQRPATIVVTASSLSGPLTATVAPGKTWLPLNVTIDANDRGDTPSSYRARELGTGHQVKRYLEVPPECCKVAAFGRDVLLSGSARQRMTRAAPVAGAHA